ncbi:MAG: NAD-dependent epimerase/dehydratase family protein [Chloroflexota bacterium]|nr:NAD-dependent epimerase/dehydratase family protein [Chloroflexota bacterium]
MTPNHELHVVFGTGPLGIWTMRELVERGKRVRMINRSGRKDGLPDGVEITKGDAYAVTDTTALTRGATAVYQCAQPPYNQWAGNFPRMQAAILDGAAANGARLIVGENLYMYGDPNGQPLTEASPYAAHTRKGAIRQAMTEALFAAHRAGKLRVASARASDFFGPDDPIYGGLWYQPALAGKRLNMLGRLDVPHSFSYVPDFGKALAILGTREEGLGRAWHIPSPPPVTQAELIALIEEQVGRPLKPVAAGAVMLGLLGLMNPIVREMSEMLYEWNKPFVIDSSAFERTFGMQPTPLRDAVEATVDWNRANGAGVAAVAH